MSTQNLLNPGMTRSDVLSHWGVASEKIEYEPKRQELWQYGKTFVLFENGRVALWGRGELKQFLEPPENDEADTISKNRAELDAELDIEELKSLKSGASDPLIENSIEKDLSSPALLQNPSDQSDTESLESSPIFVKPGASRSREGASADLSSGPIFVKPGANTIRK